jgi:uncharacterized protein (TIGR03067 family)
MSDRDRMQGLWRVVSRVHRGSPVQDAASHYQFEGASYRQVIPNWVSDGKLRATFRLEEDAEPKRFVFTLDFNGPDGPPDPKPIVQQGFYRLEGDRLLLAYGPSGEFPETFSDAHGLLTLEREGGPAPEERQPSGKPPIEDPVLGRLAWDDNLSWYQGELRHEERVVSITVEPDEQGEPATALARARGVAARLPEYIQLARRYAVESLLELKNDAWREDDEPELTPEQFAARISLQSVVVHGDGALTLYHDDGDLFWGHSIQVCLDAQDRCTGTDIPG